MTMDTTENEKPKTEWAEALAASAAADKPEERTRKVFELIKVPVTDVALAKIARDNAADDLAKQNLEAELDALKADVKDKKAEVDEVDRRMSSRHEAVRTGVQELKGEWHRREIFATNTVQYIDPATGVVVYERPLTAAERQVELGFNGSTDNDQPAEDDDLDEDNGESPPDGSEGGDDEEDYADLASDQDSTTNLDGDPDEPSIEDPSALLDAAGAGAEPASAEPPSKPTRRRRKAK